MSYQSTEELEQEHQRRTEELAALNVALNALKYITSPDAVRAVLAIRAAIETQLEPARYAVDTSGLVLAKSIGERWLAASDDALQGPLSLSNHPAGG